MEIHESPESMSHEQLLELHEWKSALISNISYFIITRVEQDANAISEGMEENVAPLVPALDGILTAAADREAGGDKDDLYARVKAAGLMACVIGLVATAPSRSAFEEGLQGILGEQADDIEDEARRHMISMLAEKVTPEA